ncbi:MAG TPA: hypothetical protein VFT78_06070 [Hanamia sp.]|nr:hypothetical protein [Hanamia sp.]
MKRTIRIGIFLLIIFITVAFLIFYVNKKNDAEDRLRRSVIENIQFKGRIINSTVIDRYGKKYVVWCIKLDYTNTDSIYIFNDLDAVKIKNGIATIPGGLYQKDLIPTYVEINMNNSLVNRIYYQNGQFREYEMGLGSGGLIEKDMKDCN